MKRIKNLILIAIVATSLSACKATAEKEQKKFESNKSQILGLTHELPKYTPAINMYISELDKKWAEAEAVAEEEAKIDAMQRVNSGAKSGAIAPFFKVKSAMDEIESNIQFLEGRNASEVQIAVLREIEKSSTALNEVKAKLNEGEQISDLGKASQEVSVYLVTLKEANSIISVAVKQLEEKDAEEKAAQEKAAEAEAQAQEAAAAQSTTTSAPAATTQTEVKMVACKYCKAKNEAANTKCKSCGASL